MLTRRHVRHIEIGTSSVWVLTGGIALLFFGLAIALGRDYPRLLGWAAMALGVVQVANSVELARHGFAFSPLSIASLLLAPWALIVAVLLLFGFGGGSPALQKCGQLRVRFPIKRIARERLPQSLFRGLDLPMLFKTHT